MSGIILPYTQCGCPACTLVRLMGKYAAVSGGLILPPSARQSAGYAAFASTTSAMLGINTSVPTTAVPITPTAPEKPAYRQPSNLPPVQTYAAEDFELTIDEVYGVRRWRVGTDGHLHPVAWAAKIWTPGVNTAECIASWQATPILTIVDPTGQGRHATTIRAESVIRPAETGWLRAVQSTVQQGYRVEWSDGTSDAYSVRELTFLDDVPEHETPHEWCTCGFYAYNDTRWLGEYSAAPITGVVKLTGRVLVGSKGFRAEKAEIVALAKPSSALAALWAAAFGQGDTPPMSKISERYPDVAVMPYDDMLAEFPPTTVG